MPKRKKAAASKGAPEWMVTYGDMMSLLLCFFVILVSMSEVKKDEKFQEVMDSIRAAFGYDGSLGSVPVPNTIKNSLVEQLREIVLPDLRDREGDSDIEGIDGRVFRVTNVREGISVEVGGRISFDRFSAELKPGAVDLLQRLAARIMGHNTVIHVRGHATREPLPAGHAYQDPMELSLARAQAVAAALMSEGIRSERIRIVGAGSHEPLVAQAYTEDRQAANRRTEVVVTEAIVEDYSGEPLSVEEREPGYGP